MSAVSEGVQQYIVVVVVALAVAACDSLKDISSYFTVQHRPSLTHSMANYPHSQVVLNQLQTITWHGACNCAQLGCIIVTRPVLMVLFILVPRVL